MRVAGFCGLGVRHNIEVEDQVTAYFEYANGATGVFVTSTCEAPGTNRLEIAGQRGKLVLDDGKLCFTRNEITSGEFIRTSPLGFAKPDVRIIDIPVCSGGSHAEVMQNFVDAILDGVPLIAPAEEGINSVELANSMLYSSIEGRPIDLPLNGVVYEKMLKRLIEQSTCNKTVAQPLYEDISGSFQKA